MLNIDAQNDKQEMVSGVKVLQIQQIVREDMDMPFKQLHEDYSLEMNMITVAIQSIVNKQDKLGKIQFYKDKNNLPTR